MTAGRPVVFTVVGMAGFAVQAGALWLLAGRAGMALVPATLLATELAVLHNFAWHARWTWADRPAASSVTAARLLRFNVSNGGVSLAGAAVLMPILVDGVGLHFLAANLLTVLACAVVNYAAGDRWLFAPIRG